MSDKARCPNCHAAVTPYVGDNPHKAGTAWCEKCGTRVVLGDVAPPIEAPAEEPMTLAEAAEVTDADQPAATPVRGSGKKD